VQGAANDCYLISAMIALAWSRPAEWLQRVKATARRAAGVTKYRYAFYRGRHTREAALAVAPRLPADARGRLAYARAAQGTEAWPAMYEKAFVMRASGCAPDDPQPKDYRAISDNRLRPQIACRMLAGGASHAVGSELLGGEPPTAVVRARCDARGVTAAPTMAWTWDTVESMKGLGWKSTGLHANHAYAVLGTVSKNDRTYVVLRNPWGRAPYCPGAHATGPWAPGAGPCGAPEVLLNRAGVLALRADWFDTCFAQVGWVD